MSWKRSLVVVCLLVGIVVDARAQDLGVFALATSTNHDRLGEPLFGGGASLRFPVGRVLALRAGGDYVRGVGDRTGIPCAGLLYPGECPPEAVRDEGHITTVSAGVAARLFERGSMRIMLGGDAVRSVLHSETRGRTSGRSIDDGAVFWGARLAIDAQWRPASTLPLAFEIGGALSELAPRSRVAAIDGYSVLIDDVRTWRLHVGLTALSKRKRRGG